MARPKKRRETRRCIGIPVAALSCPHVQGFCLGLVLLFFVWEYDAHGPWVGWFTIAMEMDAGHSSHIP